MNNSKIILYTGRRGAGKTLTMVRDAYKYYLNNWKIITNMTSLVFGEKMEGEEILKIDKSSNLNNCILVFDEIQIYFDSRSFGSKKNKTFSNFIQQIRKRNIILLVTTQYLNTIEKRLRQHIDIEVYPDYIEKYPICKATYIDITSLENNILETLKEPKSTTTIYDPLPIFKLFKTEEIIA